jgi:GTP-dependent phosphoenolpyruvate carboxykinase
MTYVFPAALDCLPIDGEFIFSVHSVSYPLKPDVPDICWPCNPETSHVIHYPEMSEISIFDSAYGGKSLLREYGAVLELIQIFTGKKVGWRNMFLCLASKIHNVTKLPSQ